MMGRTLFRLLMLVERTGRSLCPMWTSSSPPVTLNTSTPIPAPAHLRLTGRTLIWTGWLIRANWRLQCPFPWTGQGPFSIHCLQTSEDGSLPAVSSAAPVSRTKRRVTMVTVRRRVCWWMREGCTQHCDPRVSAPTRGKQGARGRRMRRSLVWLVVSKTWCQCSGSNR